MQSLMMDTSMCLYLKTPEVRRLNLQARQWELFFQQRLRNPDATYFKTNAVRIESEPPIKLQIDGDVAGESGVYIKVLPRALKLIVP